VPGYPSTRPAFAALLCWGALLQAGACGAAGFMDALKSIGEAIGDGVGQVVKGVETGVQANLTGESTVIGTVAVSSPMVGYVTCFKDVPGSALGATPLTNIGQARGFPAMIVTRTGIVTSGKCDELQKNGLLVPVAGGASGAGRPADHRAFATTELAGFFERHPQPGGGRVAAWPRVVVTLVAMPGWGWDRVDVHRFKAPGLGCWKFRATIWESESNSREVAPFHSCSDESLKVPSGDASAYYQTWSGLVGSGSQLVTPGSTGIQRTEGPVWPDTPLPVAKLSTSRQLGMVTFTGERIAGVLYATGIDFRQRDSRLWLNVAPEIEPR
jgi:hypothetical protein